MTERDRIIEKMAFAIAQRDPVAQEVNTRGDREVLGMHYKMADAALRVIESPPDPADTPTRICTCGQNGYPENHWHSNHPHTEDCPQYAKAS